MTVNLNNAPSHGSPVVGPIHISFPNDFGNREYEITELYRQWKNGTIPNYGIEISSPTVGCNNASVAFMVYSSDEADESKRPYLRIMTNQYTITATANPAAGGSVSCSPNPVNHGSTSTCTITTNTGYTLDGVSGTCGGTLNGNTYTTNPITADCTVEATFTLNQPNQHTITELANPTAGGSVDCNPNPVDHGSTSTCTITTNTGYTLERVGGTCGGTLDGNTYTTDPITADCTVEATFSAPAPDSAPPAISIYPICGRYCDESAMQNPVDLRFDFSNLDTETCKEMFLILNAPVLGINWSYLNAQGQWIPIPEDLSQITPLGCVPGNGEFSLYQGDLPVGVYELYMGFDFIENGHLDFYYNNRFNYVVYDYLRIQVVQ